MTKRRIYPDDSDPLWQECKRRFAIEVKAPPDPLVRDTQNFYYTATRGRLNVTDYNWYLLDDTLIIRERKSGV
jgi:hypothetical protein